MFELVVGFMCTATELLTVSLWQLIVLYKWPLLMLHAKGFSACVRW